MAEPTDTLVKLLTDNRTALVGRDTAGTRLAVLPTLPDGKLFVAKKADGTDATGTETAATSTVPAYVASADADRVVVPLDYATTVGGGVNTSKYARRQLFKTVDLVSGGVTEKWCYVDIHNRPLTAAGVVATVADAADASTTALTAVGAAVPNGAQPGPMPGTYSVSDMQMLYSPYIGWTVKQTAKV